MKILFTGYTTLQITPPDKRNGGIKKLDVPAAIVQAMIDNGHTVDWRQTRVGEDLQTGGYDLIWLNIASPASVNSSRGALGALWTVNSGLPMIGFLDDWQYRQNLRAHKLLVTDPKARLYATLGKGDKKTPLHGGETFDVIERWENELVYGSQCMLGDRWKQGMVPVAPLYMWGDPSIVAKRVSKDTWLPPVFGIDPSFITKPFLEEAWARISKLTSPRQRMWQLGAIAKHHSWLEKIVADGGNHWPASQFGHAGSGGERLPSETDVIARYATGWGVLSPPYPQNGSGWFRSRFIYAAFTGSVLWCEKGEADALGAPYRYPMQWIEQMSDDHLATLATEQREALWPHLTGREAFTNRIEQLCAYAVTSDRGGRDNR